MNFNMITPEGQVQPIPRGIRPDVVRFYLAVKAKGVEIKNGRLIWGLFKIDEKYSIFGGGAFGYSAEDTRTIIMAGDVYKFPFKTEHINLFGTDPNDTLHG